MLTKYSLGCSRIPLCSVIESEASFTACLQFSIYHLASASDRRLRLPVLISAIGLSVANLAVISGLASDLTPMNLVRLLTSLVSFWNSASLPLTGTPRSAVTSARRLVISVSLGLAPFLGSGISVKPEIQSLPAALSLLAISRAVARSTGLSLANSTSIAGRAFGWFSPTTSPTITSDWL